MVIAKPLNGKFEQVKFSFLFAKSANASIRHDADCHLNQRERKSWIANLFVLPKLLAYNHNIMLAENDDDVSS